MGRRIQRNPRDRIEGSKMWRTVARPVDWPARVEAVLKRDQVCQWRISAAGHICGFDQDLEVDHIGDPADHDLSNLRALCRTHHRRRTASQGGKAAAARRIPRKRPAEKHPGIVD